MLPQDKIGPFKPVTRDDIEWFNESLSDEIDSAYASSIRCCENCYSDFQSSWPGTTFKNIEFQEGAIDVNLLVEQSRLPDIFDHATFSTLKHFVECPRCARVIDGYVWIHEHEAAEQFADGINRLGGIANSTPFLMLNDPFAQDVLSAVEATCATIRPKRLPAPLFRASALKHLDVESMESPDVDAFSAPPPQFTGEGRFNHSAKPVLYLSDSLNTATAEIGATDSNVYVAALEFPSSYRILDFVDVDPDDPRTGLFSAIAQSALMAAPQTSSGWEKKEYVFTRFVADCARNFDFDLIRFGSTKAAAGNNYVFLSPPAKISKICKLKYVKHPNKN